VFWFHPTIFEYYLPVGGFHSVDVEDSDPQLLCQAAGLSILNVSKKCTAFIIKG
jgi:hypothetical protein